MCIYNSVGYIYIYTYVYIYIYVYKFRCTNKEKICIYINMNKSNDEPPCRGRSDLPVDTMAIYMYIYSI